MKHFYFWQNMVSMHQSAFLRALAGQEGCKVYLIVEELLQDERKKMGWSIPDLGKVELFSFGDKNFDWEPILLASKQQNSYHIFSGIGSAKMKGPFKLAVKSRCTIGIMAESLDDRGWKGFIRLSLSRLNRIRFGRHIRFWLTIGENAYRQYSGQVGYPEAKLLNWAYCVEELPPVSPGPVADTGNEVKIMYVGSLYPWKGYDLLVDALMNLKALNYKADFYSIGKNDQDKAAALQEKTAALKGKIAFLPMMENSLVRNKMAAYDLLVLPSRYDGWGTVINEALMAGTPVIASSSCGASALVDHNPGIGTVCKGGNSTDLEEKLQQYIKNGSWSEVQRKELKTWAISHISGTALQQYFLKIVAYIDNNSTDKPKAPWI